MRYIEYHEQRKHGTADFPFAFYKIDPAHHRYIMTYHWHKETEIIRVLSGCFSLTLNNSEYMINSGEAMIIPGGALHGGVPVDCNYECIVFDLESVLSDSRIGKRFLYSSYGEDIDLKNHFTSSFKDIQLTINAMFDDIAAEKNGYKFLIYGHVFSLIGKILQYDCFEHKEPVSSTIKKRTSQYKTIINFIENNYKNNISLKDLSDSVHMNSRYFCRFFKELTHQTPIEYLNSYRIETACELLSYTGKNVTDVAFECGFNDISYFIKVFKKFKGMTPIQYSKKKNNLKIQEP